MDDVPLASIFTDNAEAEKWNDYYTCPLDAKFPNQDGDEFVMALCYNKGIEDVDDFELLKELTNFKMIEQGANDEGDWIWSFDFRGASYKAVGGCDYTGWDCQSGLEITKV